LKDIYKIFKGSNVLITGHTGFKGSWLTLLLKLLGANITGVSLSVPSQPSLFDILNLKKDIKDFRFNIFDENKLKKIINELKPDFIFHLAAQPLVFESYKNPLETWQTNLMGTINVLESISILDNKCSIILITSDKVYKNYEKINGYSEGDELGGDDPYSASKAASELAINSYINSKLSKKNNLNIGIGRAGNVIGGGDWAKNRLVPDCVLSWSNSKKVQIRNPSSTRPWQHVLEPLSGYINFAASLDSNINLRNEIFNFGPGIKNIFTVKDLVSKMSDYWTKVQWLDSSFENNNPNETNLLHLNCDKAEEKLNWKSKWNFDKTVKETINWYKDYYEKDNKFIKQKSINQINDYLGANYKL